MPDDVFRKLALFPNFSAKITAFEPTCSDQRFMLSDEMKVHAAEWLDIIEH